MGIAGGNAWGLHMDSMGTTTPFPYGWQKSNFRVGTIHHASPRIPTQYFCNAWGGYAWVSEIGV